jgi:cupin fold WbuC family metalloprotein
VDFHKHALRQEAAMKERKIQTINRQLLDDLLQRARSLPRKRALLRLHDDDWEHAHRMLNALTPGTYVTPHRHADRYKGEGFILLRGKLAVLIFDDNGTLDRAQSRVLSSATGCLGMELPPGVWHSLVALEEAVIYEVKGQPAGGYVQALDKEFAPWAPAEGAPLAVAYGRQLDEWARQLDAPA